MAEPRFARTGAAARKAAPGKSTAGGPRAPRRPAAATSESAIAISPPTAATPADEVAVRLAIALAELPEEIRRLVTVYRGQVLDDEQWTLVGDLVHLGMAVYQPTGRSGLNNLGWALSVHARVHLLLGTSRTIAGWYGPDALDQTLSEGRVGRGPAAFTPPAYFASSYNGRLRAIGRTLVPSTPPPPKKYGGREPVEPLTTAELDEVLDYCDAHRSPRGGNRRGQRLARLVWLVCGTGAANADLVHAGDAGPQHVTGMAVERTPHAVVFTTAGPQPRRIPVLASCEAAVLDAALSAGEQPLLDKLPRATQVTERVVEASGWRERERFPLTARRLRQTWLATVLASGAPYQGILRAAGRSGERSLAALVAHLPALDEVTYETALRCGTGPLPTVGQQLLPGLHHPAPPVPLVGRS